MKKKILTLLAILILGHAGVSYADMNTKLSNHWSRGLIEEDFLSYYFPYLSKENFKRLSPNSNITKRDFIISLNSLSKNYNLDTNFDNLDANQSVTRQEMVSLIGNKIKNLDFENKKNKKIPFQDINTMNNSSIELLRLLYNLDIINGVSTTKFAPNKKVSQAEAIIILQGLKGVLDDMKNIEFKTIGMIQSYNNKESIIVRNKGNKVEVTITKAFPTPGYYLSIDKIRNNKDGYKIYLNSIEPREDSIQMQVITYKTITLEIDKKELNKPEPYKFVVGGEDFPSGL